jgi:hypothetical protein
MKIHIENLQHQTDAITQTINSIKKQEQNHFAIEMVLLDKYSFLNLNYLN